MIVVTGMHRSGTSLVCQLLQAMGLDFGAPEDRFAADRWNEPGYFESKAVMDLNSEIVTGFPRNRGRARAMLSRLRYAMMPGPAGMARRAARVRERLQALAEEHRDHALKDPRFCLTLRFWQEVAEVERVVVCLRRPAAVVASLQRRDHLPRGRGYRFFAYHLASLLEQLPVERSLLVDVDALFGEGGGEELALLCTFLRLELPISPAALLGEVVRPELYRRAGDEQEQLPPTTQALWEQACELRARRRCEVLADAEAGRS